MINEVRGYIQHSYPELYEELEKKSYDYLRITISASPGRDFAKFECPTEQFEGEMSRTGFWGLSGEEYGWKWVRVEWGRREDGSRISDGTGRNAGARRENRAGGRIYGAW
jgi:hypothetical protein